MIIPDVNLLVYAYNECAPHHANSKLWWEELLNGTQNIGIPWVVTSGFLRIMTHRRIMSSPMKPADAFMKVKEWFATPQVTPINPGTRHLSLMDQLLESTGVAGNLVTDIHIAAIAIEYQAELPSNDSDFSRFPGLKWMNPIREE